jgi:hypothetical protein
MKDLLAFFFLIAMGLAAVPFGLKVVNNCRSPKDGVIVCVSAAWFDAVAEAKR